MVSKLTMILAGYQTLKNYLCWEMTAGIKSFVKLLVKMYIPDLILMSPGKHNLRIFQSLQIYLCEEMEGTF